MTQHGTQEIPQSEASPNTQQPSHTHPNYSLAYINSQIQKKSQTLKPSKIPKYNILQIFTYPTKSTYFPKQHPNPPHPNQKIPNLLNFFKNSTNLSKKSLKNLQPQVKAIPSPNQIIKLN